MLDFKSIWEFLKLLVKSAGPNTRRLRILKTFEWIRILGIILHASCCLHWSGPWDDGSRPVTTWCSYRFLVKSGRVCIHSMPYWAITRDWLGHLDNMGSAATVTHKIQSVHLDMGFMVLFSATANWGSFPFTGKMKQLLRSMHKNKFINQSWWNQPNISDELDLKSIDLVIQQV